MLPFQPLYSFPLHDSDQPCLSVRLAFYIIVCFVPVQSIFFCIIITHIFNTLTTIIYSFSNTHTTTTNIFKNNIYLAQHFKLAFCTVCICRFKTKTVLLDLFCSFLKLACFQFLLRQHSIRAFSALLLLHTSSTNTTTRIHNGRPSLHPQDPDCHHCRRR